MLNVRTDDEWVGPWNGFSELSQNTRGLFALKWGIEEKLVTSPTNPLFSFVYDELIRKIPERLLGAEGCHLYEAGAVIMLPNAVGQDWHMDVEPLPKRRAEESEGDETHWVTTLGVGPDSVTLRTRPPTLVYVFVPLVDMSKENGGGTEFCKKSNFFTDADSRILPINLLSTIKDESTRRSMNDAMERVRAAGDAGTDPVFQMRCRAGQPFIFDARCVHRSVPGPSEFPGGPGANRPVLFFGFANPDFKHSDDYVPFAARSLGELDH